MRGGASCVQMGEDASRTSGAEELATSLVAWEPTLRIEPERTVGRGLGRFLWALVWPLPVYAVLAVGLFAGAWFGPPEAWIGYGDPQLFMWYLGWVPHSVSHLQDPLLTTYLNYPYGVNLMWNTSVIVPALVLWPVTAAFGVATAYNVMTTAAVAFSAWTAYLAAGRYVRSSLAAAVAGLLYGFSPFMTLQSRGHAHVTIALLPPLVLLILDELFVRRRRSPLLLGALLGLACALQLLTGEEVLALTALAGALGVAVLAILRPRQAWAAVPRALLCLAACLAVFLPLAAYPLGEQLLGPQRVFGPLQQIGGAVMDLLGFVVPGRGMALTTPAAVALTGHFSAGVPENDGYVGVPLILLVLLALVLLWRRLLVRWALLTALLIGVLSLGPQLRTGGALTPVPLPWALVQRLPLMASGLPSRMALFVFLLLGLVLAVFLDAALRTGRRRLALPAASLVALALVPLAPHVPFPVSTAPVPAFFEPGGEVSRVPPDSVALVAPIADSHASEAMYWQAAAGFRFRMPEGDAFTPGPNLGPRDSYVGGTVRDLDAPDTPTPTVTPERRQRALDELRARHVRTVIAGPSPGRARIVAFLTAVLGRPPERTGGVDVWWDVDRGVAA
jgi:hypothetical protein